MLKRQGSTFFTSSATSLQSYSPAVPSTVIAESSFIRYSLDGKEVTLVDVALDGSNKLLWVLTKATPPEMTLDLLQLKFVETGNQPKETSKIKKLFGLDKVHPSQFLTLYFGDWPWKSFHLASPHSDVVQVWLQKLAAFADSILLRSEPFFDHPCSDGPLSSPSTHLEIWLQRLYAQLRQIYGDKLQLANVMAAFTRDRFWKGHKLWKEVQKFNSDLAGVPTCNPSFSLVKCLYFSVMALWRQDIRALYLRHCDLKQPSLVHPFPDAQQTTRRRGTIIPFLSKSSKSHKASVPIVGLDSPVNMSMEQFSNFLAFSQDRDSVDVDEATAIIAEYDAFAGKSDTSYISLKGFAHYMLCQEVTPLPHLSQINAQKMDQPLSRYLIASSHNTYLTGHQLHGESSVSMYIKVLRTGVRCVELDCWDGDNEEPVIYHGHTLTTKVKFRDVVEAIAEHAFVASPYPLVLSLENHCSIALQNKMVMYMKKAFQHMLLTEQPNEIEKLPSPEELKYKILIKHRKIRDSRDRCDVMQVHTRSGSSPAVISLNPPPQKRKSTAFPRSYSSPSTSPLSPTSPCRKLFSPQLTRHKFFFQSRNWDPSPKRRAVFPGLSNTLPAIPGTPNLDSKPGFSKMKMPSVELSTQQQLVPKWKAFTTTGNPAAETGIQDHLSPTLPNSGGSRRLLTRQNALCADNADVRSSRKQASDDAEVGCDNPTDMLPCEVNKNKSQLRRPKLKRLALCRSITPPFLRVSQKGFEEMDVVEEKVIELPSPEASTGNSWGNPPPPATSLATSLLRPQRSFYRNQRPGSDSCVSDQQLSPLVLQSLQVLHRRMSLDDVKVKVAGGSPVSEVKVAGGSPVSEVKVAGGSPVSEVKVAGGSPVSEVKVAGGSPVSEVKVAGGSPVSEVKVAGGSPVSEVKVAGGSPVSEVKVADGNPLSEVKVAGGSPVSEVKVAGGSPLSEVKVAGGSPVSEVKVAGGSPVSEVKVAGCSPVSEVKVAGGSPLSEVKVAGGSPLSEVKVAGGSPVLEVKVAGGSPVSEVKVAGCSPVLEVKVSGGSPVSEVKVAGGSPVSEVKVADGSPVSEVKVAGGSPASEVKVAGGSRHTSPVHSAAPGGRQNLLRTVLRTSSVKQRLTHSSSYKCDSGDSSDSQAQDCRDTAAASYDSKNIAKQLSDMVVYTETVKFTGFKRQEYKATDMLSLSESVTKKAIKKTPNEFLSFNESHLNRVYPNATRINSSNYNPAYYWSRGCQMVSLNYQTNDTPMQHNIALFQQNGGCGYVPKPCNWREMLAGSKNTDPATLTLTLVSGQHLTDSQPSLPTVEIQILDATGETCRGKLQASSCSDNYTHWESGAVVSTDIVFVPYSTIKFTVYSEKPMSTLLHVHATPLSTIRTGYQHVFFTDSSYNLSQPPPSLFMHIKLRTNDIEREVLPAGRNQSILHVKVSVEENAEMKSMALSSLQPIAGEKLMYQIIKKARLEGRSSDYCLYLNGNLVDSATLIEPCTEGLELKDAPYQPYAQLVQVSILYSDLIGVNYESICLFADANTSVMDLLSASVARLGSDIAKVCPQFQGCEEEEETRQKLFCMVYAQYQDIGLRRMQVLNPELQVLKLFPASDQGCLMLHTTEQDHHLMEFVPVHRPASSPQSNSNSLSNSLASSPVGLPEGLLLPTSSINMECGGTHSFRKHFFHRGSSHVPKLTQEDLEHGVDKDVVQHTCRREKGKKEKKKEEKRISQINLEQLPVPDSSTGGGELMLPKQRKSKRWFKKSSAHSVECACIYPSQESTLKEEKIKQSKRKRKWTLTGKGQHRRELIELEKADSLLMEYSSKQQGEEN